MASVFPRGKKKKWYLKYRDHTGSWVTEVSTAATKTEAKRLAADLERRCERQRHGLEPLPAVDGGGTLDDLLEWWLKTYSIHSASHVRNMSTLGANLLGSELGKFRLVDLKDGDIERFLQEKSATQGPQSLNHLRRFIVVAFNKANAAGRYKGPNPALTVKRRKVPQRKPDYLRTEEVPLVLAALDPKWRPLYATAIYTGFRRGELIGLRKSSVDLEARLLTAKHSYNRLIPKGGHEDVIPIATELVPYLRQAIDASPSELVFPKADGTMLSKDTDLEGKLRRMLKRAGIITDYEHVCRRKGCGHSERALDPGLRRCPTDERKLWPKANVRQIRFQDLRHTTASLLMMAGANPAAVQRILRHRDPRLTVDVYGHLAPDYLRAEVDRLRFAPPVAEPTNTEPTNPPTNPPEVETPDPFGTPVVQEDSEGPSEDDSEDDEPPEIPIDLLARHTRLERVTYGFGGRRSIQLS